MNIALLRSEDGDFEPRPTFHYLQHLALMDKITLVRSLGLSFVALQFLARGYINIGHSLAARAV